MHGVTALMTMLSIKQIGQGITLKQAFVINSPLEGWQPKVDGVDVFFVISFSFNNEKVNIG